VSHSYLLVANPTAQSGRASERIDDARRGLENMGRSVTLLPTEPEGRTVGAVTRALDDGSYDVVIAMGGDGTFSEVACGLLAAKRQVLLGLLPAGTANDQGKSFGISSDPDALATNLETIVLEHVVDIDVGHVERLDAAGEPTDERLFFDSAGWGIQAEILWVRNRDRGVVQQIPFLREFYRDQAVYAGATLNRYLASWVEPTKFSLDLVADGASHRYDGLTDVIVSATPIYAANWVLDPKARADDGLFELVAIEGRRDWLLTAVRDLTSVTDLREHFEALGLGYRPGLASASFDLTLSREGRPEVASQIDGEVWLSGRRFRVTVDAGALPLIVPKGFAPPWAEA
jgi:diacylglycerol kinase family enzyme